MLKRADAILTQLESQGQESPAPMKQTHAVSEQILLFDPAEENPILAELAKVDVYNMTPDASRNLFVRMETKSKNPPSPVRVSCCIISSEPQLVDV